MSCAKGDNEELVPEASTAAYLGWTHGPCEGSQGQNGVSGAASTMTDVRGLGHLVWRPQLPDHWGRRVLCPQERHVVVTWEDTRADPTCLDGSSPQGVRACQLGGTEAIPPAPDQRAEAPSQRRTSTDPTGHVSKSRAGNPTLGPE